MYDLKWRYFNDNHVIFVDDPLKFIKNSYTNFPPYMLFYVKISVQTISIHEYQNIQGKHILN